MDRVTDSVLALLDSQPHFEPCMPWECPHDHTCITAQQQCELESGHTVTCQRCNGVMKPEKEVKIR